MENIHNFRDLGGIPTMDGHKIKNGLFFRSDAPGAASKADIEQLKSLGIKVVFDYRDNEELPKNPDKFARSIGADYRHFATGIKEGKLYKIQNGSFFYKATAMVKPEDVMQTYRLLPFCGEGYKAMLSALVGGEVPFLQHCTAGKDRAGMGSALLLAVLGVGYDEILKDYLLSAAAQKYLENEICKQIPKFMQKTILRHYYPIFTVDKLFIDNAYGEIVKKHGDFKAYLLDRYGLNDKIIAELRAKYTE